MIRQATAADIPQIQYVRNAVKENQLSDPALVPDGDVEDYLNRRGRGWVYEANKLLVLQLPTCRIITSGPCFYYPNRQE